LLQSQSDQSKFLQITLQTWGVILFLLTCLIIIKNHPNYVKNIGDQKAFVYSAALTAGASFFFLTRAHERHLLPFIAILTLAIPFLQKQSFLFYLILSLSSVISLFVSLAWQEWRILFWYDTIPPVLSIINLVIFIWLLIWPPFLNLQIKKNKS
jgi:hypothetical protein